MKNNWNDKARKNPSLAANAARGIREATDPGPKRIALLAGIGVAAGPGDSAPATNPNLSELPKIKRRPSRAGKKRSTKGLEQWREFVASIRSTDAPRNERLVLWFPGLVLPSENKAQRSNAVKRGSWVNLVTNLATNQARAAWIESRPAFWIFSVPVRIEVWQVAYRPRIDPGNLYKKALIDTLSERSGGVGIIRDDGPKYVVSESTGYAKGRAGVVVVIEPATVPNAESIIDRR